VITSRPSIPAGRYRERLAAAQAGAAEAGLDALLIGVGADLRYLTGYPALPLERLTMLVIPADGPWSLVAPHLEAEPARTCPPAAAGDLPVVTWEETDDPHSLVATLVSADLERPNAGHRVAVSDDLPARHLLRLRDRLPATLLELASPILRELRIVKDADEIALLTEAAHAADRVVAQIASGRLVGRTEADVSREVRTRLIAEGHDEAHFAIVGSGPNSASPHHEASDRVIAAGEPIVLDIGGSIDGYGSDITRTLWVTGGDPDRGPDTRFAHLFDVLYAAQAAAREAIRPGIPAEAIDAAAREPIAAAGFAEAFFHRTGHGIGLEEHEDPYIVAGNREALRAEMAFSVEPGIYLDGIYGARIEDIVICAPDGRLELNEAARELYVVDG
jgi:Xaa-Pro aminopeptidase